MREEYDLIIIGAGPGGYETAELASHSGKRVVLIERDKLGGTCLNRGCIPTKSLCRSAELLLQFREAAQFGIEIGDVKIDYEKAVSRKEEVVGQLREGVGILLKNVTIVNGEAKFVSPTEVEANGDIYSAPKIIIATGSRPATLPIEGAELAINSDFALEMRSLPLSMVIIGGGVIGMEFASIFSAFGVKVTVIEYCAEILPPFDADIAKRLRMSLKRRGIDIITSASVTSIVEKEGEKTVFYTTKGKEKAINTETVLMAVGRKAVIPDGAESIGLKIERGFLCVNDKMETSVSGIYAIGDVNGRCMLAHAASAQGRVALGMEQSLSPIPSAVFTHPECGMTGLTEKQCQEQGIDYSVGTAIFRANGKAMTMGETDGLVKVIAEKGNNRIVGCHICGAHAADLAQIASVAISGGIDARKLSSFVFPHPTLSEALKSATDAFIDV